MIWFNIEELERKLRKGDLSDKETFNYLLANLIVFSIAQYIQSNDYETKWLFGIELIIAVGITISGTKITYDINSSGDGKDFLKRFISLSFVVTIRLFVFVCIVAIPLGIVAYLIDYKSISNNATDLLDITFTVIGGLLYYFMLTNSFKRVCQNNTALE